MANTLEASDNITDMGRAYIMVLIITGAIFAFIAITNINDLVMFKLAMSYSILLIFAFLGQVSDQLSRDLGLDTITWSSEKLKKQLGIGLVFIVGWYLLFMQGGLALATPQSVGVSFSTNPTLNWFITAVLAPIAENAFFFGLLFFTMKYLIRKLQKQPSKVIVLAVLLMGTYYWLTNVPNILFILGISAGAMIIGAYVKDDKIRNLAAIVSAAAFIGGAIFPKYHSYAYQLNESNYVAASYFGFFVCILGPLVGMLPIDMAHIFNNALTG